LDAGVHSLGSGWAVHVGGVAGEEDAARAVAGGVPVMEAEVRHPDRVAEPQPTPGEGVGDRVQVGERGLRRLFVLVGAGHPRPHTEHAPGRGPAEREEEQHPGRPDEGLRRVAHHIPIDLEVTEREGMRVAAALVRDSRALADGAVGAVAADQVAGTHLLGASVAVAQRAGDVLLSC
jgi:hypothetical protein